MNRTLLLIICDFLLLNLLALTRWDKLEPVPSQKLPVPQLKANMAAQPNQDLVDLMKLALENERTTREQLQQRLQFAQSDVKTREQLLGQIQTQKAQLEANLNQTRQAVQDLSQRYATVSKDATQSQEKVQQLQQTLTAKQAEADRQQQALTATIKNVEAEKAKLAEQMQQAVAAKQQEIQRQQQALATLDQQKTAVQAQASNLAAAVRVAQAEKDQLREQMEKQLQLALAEKRAEIERQQKALALLEQQRNAAVQQASSLATAVKVAETERNLLRENLSDLKGEVAVVRQEKDKLQVQTAKLTDGVTQLAVKSGELTKEIRENTPVNMNLMFHEFISNRVDVSISALAPALFGSALRMKETKTVLVRDGTNVYALLHVAETPFSLAIPALGMSIVSAKVSRPAGELAKSPLYFWAADPRVVIVPVNPPPAATAIGKVYSVARNPFKFTEAVLISRGGKYYGEVEFKLDPRTPDYVRMKNRIVNRLFGEFSPSTGDLVLSKTGEFLGIMVNSDYCAVVKSFDTLPGYILDEKTTADTMRTKLEELRARLDRMPFSIR